MDAVESGGKLTRQLLTYSRKVKSEKRPINLNDQVRQAHQLLERTIPKMIEIDLLLEEDLKLVNADSVQMEQVLMNLVINARDAMPDGGRLVIKTKNIRRPDNRSASQPASDAMGRCHPQRNRTPGTVWTKRPGNRFSIRSSAPRHWEKVRDSACPWFMELSKTTKVGSHAEARLVKGLLSEFICRQ